MRAGESQSLTDGKKPVLSPEKMPSGKKTDELGGPFVFFQTPPGLILEA